MFTQTHLKERGWSPKLIKAYLGDPDQTARNPIYPRKAPPMKLWERTRVEAAEQHPAFIDYQIKRATASARSRAVAERKRQKLLSEVSAIDLCVERWPLPTLLRAALSEWEQRGADRGMYARCGADADESTKDRWAVNFVRHHLVSIGAGQRTPLLRGQTGISHAETALEHKIYQAIAEVYPELASAALHQANRLWGQMTSGQDGIAASVPSAAPFSELIGTSDSSSIRAIALYHERTRLLPTTTEAERLLAQRIGQDVFRSMLMELWSGRCAISGLDQPELLRASHLKPWAACTTDAERLDPYNGLLLSAHWDAAFDSGLATLEVDGTLLLSDRLTLTARKLLVSKSQSPRRVSHLCEAHQPYLRYHRQHVWRPR